MDAYLARQPIFDLNQKIYGYELLSRSGLDNFFRHPDPDQASSKVIADSFFLMGIQLLTGGRRAFINVTQEILLNEYLFLIPKDLIVPVLDACERIKGLEDQARHDFARGDDPVEVFQRYKRF